MDQMTFDFTARQPVLDADDTNDYHKVPASEKQLQFAHQIALRLKTRVPNDVLDDRHSLSRWIDAHKDSAPKPSRFSNYPSSKQVAFAERIARMKRRAVPDMCFKDKTLMSRWIDSNL